jgi:hypothetical protein
MPNLSIDRFVGYHIFSNGNVTTYKDKNCTQVYKTYAKDATIGQVWSWATTSGGVLIFQFKNLYEQPESYFMPTSANWYLKKADYEKILAQIKHEKDVDEKLADLDKGLWEKASDLIKKYGPWVLAAWLAKSYIETRGKNNGK